ncbi:MAG: hypothetical protein HQK53_04540 [Oligoflexia bacterium]|nr:hypothetical protein [Oligoflexia bacterium]
MSYGNKNYLLFFSFYMFCLFYTFCGNFFGPGLFQNALASAAASNSDDGTKTPPLNQNIGVPSLIDKKLNSFLEEGELLLQARYNYYSSLSDFFAKIEISEEEKSSVEHEAFSGGPLFVSDFASMSRHQFSLSLSLTYGKARSIIFDRLSDITPSRDYMLAKIKEIKSEIVNLFGSENFVPDINLDGEILDKAIRLMFTLKFSVSDFSALSMSEDFHRCQKLLYLGMRMFVESVPSPLLVNIVTGLIDSNADTDKEITALLKVFDDQLKEKMREVLSVQKFINQKINDLFAEVYVHENDPSLTLITQRFASLKNIYVKTAVLVERFRATVPADQVLPMSQSYKNAFITVINGYSLRFAIVPLLQAEKIIFESLGREIDLLKGELQSRHLLLISQLREQKEQKDKQKRLIKKQKRKHQQCQQHQDQQCQLDVEPPRPVREEDQQGQRLEAEAVEIAGAASDDILAPAPAAPGMPALPPESAASSSSAVLPSVTVGPSVSLLSPYPQEAGHLSELVALFGHNQRRDLLDRIFAKKNKKKIHMDIDVSELINLVQALGGNTSRPGSGSSHLSIYIPSSWTGYEGRGFTYCPHSPGGDIQGKMPSVVGVFRDALVDAGITPQEIDRLIISISQ